MSPSKVLCVAVLMVSLLSVPSALNGYCPFDSANSSWEYVGSECVYDSDCAEFGAKCLVEIFIDDQYNMYCVRRGCNC